MAHIGAFRAAGWDPGAYAVALVHAQDALAGTGHALSVHTYQPGELAAGAEQAIGVDALLVFGPDEADTDYLRQASRPSLICERVIEGCNYIAPDNFDMGRTAARHLLELGHTDLAAVLPGTSATVGDYHGGRLAGFVDTAAAAGHPLPDANVLFGAKGADGGDTAAATLLARPDLPHAVYVQNLPMGLSALRTLQAGGTHIPDDLSLVSTTFAQLNAQAATSHTSPPLTCVTFQKEEMGRRGVTYLASVVEGATSEPLQALLPGVLIQGASTARAAVRV